MAETTLTLVSILVSYMEGTFYIQRRLPCAIFIHIDNMYALIYNWNTILVLFAFIHSPVYSMKIWI